MQTFNKEQRQMDRNYCKDHSMHETQIQTNEERITSLERQFFSIILLLISNFGGIILVLLSI